MMKEKISFFWFRRDLRIEDNIGLTEALSSDHKIIPLFIFDEDITDELDVDDPRINFIYDQLKLINSKINSEYNSKLLVLKGKPLEVIKDLVTKYDTQAVYTNNDYEPYAISRDQKVCDFLKTRDIRFLSFKDQVIFEKNEITKDDKSAYVVYTPFMKKWKVKLHSINLDKHKNNNLINNFRTNNEDFNWNELEYFGFKKSNKKIPNYRISDDIIENYQAERDFPALDSTTRIGPHLRFGTVSIRRIVLETINCKNEVFLQELIWREFFMQILWFYPNTQTRCFKSKYEKVQWLNDELLFTKWCEGKTGYPIVDAGMRELNSTGYMHNRVRMVTASFLCKHLLIDWRWGEAYFAKKLYDYELSSNIGNWQWAAGTGVDAAPYFRIFNPTTQALKFDKNLKYINKWVEDLNDLNYPDPIVDHKSARQRCLETYKKGLE